VKRGPPGGAGRPERDREPRGLTELRRAVKLKAWERSWQEEGTEKVRAQAGN
jgi:hypothetical protein